MKEMVAGLKTRLEVAEKLVQAETTYPGEIPLDQATPENIEQQIAESARLARESLEGLTAEQCAIRAAAKLDQEHFFEHSC